MPRTYLESFHGLRNAQTTWSVPWLSPAPAFPVSPLLINLQPHWALPGSSNEPHFSSLRICECGPLCQSHLTHPLHAHTLLLTEIPFSGIFPLPSQSLANYCGRRKVLFSEYTRRKRGQKEGEKGMVWGCTLEPAGEGWEMSLEK